MTCRPRILKYIFGRDELDGHFRNERLEPACHLDHSRLLRRNVTENDDSLELP